MEYVTTNLYFWSMGAMIGIVSTIVGYWVKEVKGLGKSLDDHNTNNGIRFLKYNKANWGARSRKRCPWFWILRN